MSASLTAVLTFLTLYLPPVLPSPLALDKGLYQKRWALWQPAYHFARSSGDTYLGKCSEFRLNSLEDLVVGGVEPHLYQCPQNPEEWLSESLFSGGFWMPQLSPVAGLEWPVLGSTVDWKWEPPSCSAVLEVSSSSLDAWHLLTLRVS